MALKTSILVFYLRLSKNTQQVLRMASWVVLAIVNVSGVVLTLLNIFQCRPIPASFSYPYTGQAKCIPLLTEFICSAPINIVTDLAILALPIPVLTGMRLPRRQKYILVITFSLGIFVTIVDVVRIYYLQQAITSAPTTSSSDPTAIFGDSPEFAWNASFALMWSAVEVNIGMICACIPTLKPLIIKLLPAAIIDPDGTQNSNMSTYATNSDKDTVVATRNGTDPPVSPSGGLAAPSPAQHGSSSTEQLDFLEFLTTPDMVNDNPSTAAAQDRAIGSGARTTWMLQRPRCESRQDNAVYFGFVNMKRPKSMIKTSPSESLRYCITVSTLFLMWGFSYGLLNTLNNVIASVANMTTAETIGLTSAYFGGGYFFGPLIVGEWVLRHDEHARFHRRRHKHRDPVGGFKATFIMGLCIYGIGTIMFWPSAVLASFPGFIIANFVVGFGLGVLETAANPFIILCGPREYAETRILLAQGFQGVAAVVSGVLAQKVFFVDLSDGQELTPMELVDVQWTYLAITLFCVILALFFYYMPLPEVRDAELGRAANCLPVDPKKRSLGGLQLRTVCIILAVFAQWTYVAAQESMSIFFRDLVTAFIPTTASFGTERPAGLSLSVTNYLLIAHAVFAVGRFNAAHITWLGVRYPRSRLIPSPRTMLLLCALMSALFALLCVVLKPTGNANLIAIPAVLFFFTEAPLWPLIFTMGLRGQGDRTKRASAWLTMGASGPAIWPFVMYTIANNNGEDYPWNSSRLQLAYVVVVVLLLFTLAYPVFLTVVRDARHLVDPVFRGRIVGAGGGLGGLEHPDNSARSSLDHDLSHVNTLDEGGTWTRGQQSNSRDSSGGGMSELATLMIRRLNLSGIHKKRGKRAREGSSSTAASGVAQYEHRETRRDSGFGPGGGSRDGDSYRDGNRHATTPTIPEEQ